MVWVLIETPMAVLCHQSILIIKIKRLKSKRVRGCALYKYTPLYPLSEFGTYRVRAVIYVSQLGKYFVSPQLNIEITEGRQLWQQTVGVPEGLGQGRARTFTILAHRLPRTTMLYLRVEDKEAGLSIARRSLDVSSLSRVPTSKSMAETKSTSCRTPPQRHFCIPILMSTARCSNKGLSGL